MRNKNHKVLYQRMILHKLPSLTHLTLTWPSTNGGLKCCTRESPIDFSRSWPIFLNSTFNRSILQKNNSLPRPSMGEKKTLTDSWISEMPWDPSLICCKIISVLFFFLLNNISRTVQIAIFAYHHGRDSESRMLIPSHKDIHKWISISDREDTTDSGPHFWSISANLAW